MTELRQEETQQELFGEYSTRPASTGAARLNIAKAQKPLLLSTNVEQVILAAIILILVLCFVFFLGILRGRSIAGTGSGVSQPAAAPITPPRANFAAIKPAAAAQSRSVFAQAVASKSPVSPSAGKPLSVAVNAKTDGSKPYTLQIVTYKRQDLAEKDVAYWRSKGFYTVIIPSGNYFQVCVGQYNGKEEAESDRRFFASRYKGVYLRRR